MPEARGMVKDTLWVDVTSDVEDGSQLLNI